MGRSELLFQRQMRCLFTPFWKCQLIWPTKPDIRQTAIPKFTGERQVASYLKLEAVGDVDQTGAGPVSK